MAALFKRSDGTNGMQVSRFGRGSLLIVAGLFIVALISGAFIYGNSKNTDKPKPQSETAQNQPASNSTNQGQVAVPGTSNQPQPNPQPQPSSPQPAPAPTSPAPATGGTNQTAPPAGVVNTGPEDYAPFIATAVVLLFSYYRRSRQKLQLAQLS